MGSYEIPIQSHRPLKLPYGSELSSCVAGTKAACLPLADKWPALKRLLSESFPVRGRDPGLVP